MNLLQRIFGGSPVESEPYSRVHTDIHSHLIPGIDDGSANMEQSIEMIRGLHSMGYRKLITTPHIMSDAFRNTPEIILGGLEKVKAACVEEGIDIELEAAAEYYLDDRFLDKLEKGDMLTFGGDQKYLLVETSYVAQPMGLNDMIFEMLTKGYQPVLAHPERYQYLLADKGLLEDLIDRKVIFQVNLLSLTGFYSKPVKDFAESLLERELIKFFGTDCHNVRYLDMLETLPSQKSFSQIKQIDWMNTSL